VNEEHLETFLDSVIPEATDDPSLRAQLCDGVLRKVAHAFACKIECRMQSRPVGLDADAEVITKAHVVIVGYPVEASDDA